MESCFLYRIVNNVNGKTYIGITKRPKTRMYEHFYGKRLDTISLIKQAINKYGPENFTFEVLCEGTREYIVDLEMKAITLCDTINNGYNIRSGGEDCGSGHKIIKRSDDKFIYVTGFWFPNTRTAQEHIGISDSVLAIWRKAGTLGDVQHLRKDSVKDVPVYVAGFWFDTLIRASDCLGQEQKTLRKRVKEGFIEQQDSRTGKSGEDNHMYGRKGFAHHRSKAVEIHGVIYGSILQAAEHTEFTKKMIYTRLRNKTPGFAWVEKENNNGK